MSLYYVRYLHLGVEVLTDSHTWSSDAERGIFLASQGSYLSLLKLQQALLGQA